MKTLKLDIINAKSYIIGLDPPLISPTGYWRFEYYNTKSANYASTKTAITNTMTTIK